jgi:hypothetical protein
MIETMHIVSGGCHCGNIFVELELSRELGTYEPRACDCDFCIKHCAAYVSDPQGTLTIRIKDESQSGKYHQGSGAADLLLCRSCGVLIGALYRSDGRLYASVNVKSLESRASFGAEQTVSPKKLSEGEKVQRWRNIWFADVNIRTA